MSIFHSSRHPRKWSTPKAGEAQAGIHDYMRRALRRCVLCWIPERRSAYASLVGDDGFRSLSFFIFVLIISLCPHSAHAARFSGAYLHQLCQMDKDGKETVKGGHAVCQSYIAGVIDYHTVLQSMKIAPKIDICIPEKTGSTTLHAIVLRYLEKNNTHDGFVAAPAVTMALYEKYPCK